MEIDVRTTQVISKVINEDGTVSLETVERETPLDYTDQHHDILDARWQEVRRDRDVKLAETDWIVARAYERGEPVPAEWVEYRQALRDVTKQENPFFVAWPEAPVIGVPPTPPTITTPPAEIPTSTP